MSDCKCNFHHEPMRKKARPLTSDCVVMESVVCKKKLQKVAELDVLAADLGVTVDPVTGAITETVTIEPDLDGATTNITLVEDKVINVGFVPVTVTLNGTAIAEPVFLPFQEETPCPGACPEDTVLETPFQLEAVIVQGIPAGNFEALVRIKVVFKTHLTVTRQVLAKAHDFKFVKDLNPRCEDNGDGEFEFGGE